MARRIYIYIVLTVDDPESLALSQWQRDSDSDGAHGPSAGPSYASESLSLRPRRSDMRAAAASGRSRPCCCLSAQGGRSVTIRQSVGPSRRPAGGIHLHTGRDSEEPPRSALCERGPPVPTRRGSLAGTRVTVFSSTGSRRKSAPPQGLCARMPVCQPDVWFRSHLNLSLKTFEVVQV